jgi:putative transposase
MQWLMPTHVSRYVKYHGHNGHVWQGRFKALPIQADNYFVTVAR